MAGGRPSSFTVEVADAICARIIDGESLRSICRDEAMPSTQSVMRWLRENEEFRGQYARAREEQAEGYADELVNISDERELEEVEVDGVKLAVRYDSAAVARQKLRVDTRKWVASKLLPKKYGDRQQIEHTGKVGLEALIAGDPEKK